MSPFPRPTPEAWIAHQKEVAGLTTEQALALWKAMSRRQRYRSAKALTPEGREALRTSAVRTYSRKANAWIAFRKAHSTGCTVDGCPLGPSDTGEGVLFCLLEHDHRDDEQKVGILANLVGAKRDAELAKTDCKCLWHHFLHTREQRGDNSGSVYRAALIARKTKHGCLHPLHATMDFASLVPSVTDDPLVAGFLDVAHITPDAAHPRTPTGKRKYDDPSRMDDLLSGSATVFCRFCHKLYTVCERFRLQPEAPLFADQFATLLRKSPAFVQHFDAATIGFDWKGRMDLIRDRMSASSKRRKRSQIVVPE